MLELKLVSGPTEGSAVLRTSEDHISRSRDFLALQTTYRENDDLEGEEKMEPPSFLFLPRQ